MALSEVDVAIRRKIKHGFSEANKPCALELAMLATSKEFTGFQDPKVAAQESIEYSLARRKGSGSAPSAYECQRDRCDTAIRFQGRYDGFVADAGACALKDLCLSEAWDASRTDVDIYVNVVMKEGISVADKHSGGDICPHVGCNFSCGFSVDGNAGTAGECMNEKREIPEDPASAEHTSNNQI